MTAAWQVLILSDWRFSPKERTLLKEKFGVDTDKYGLSYMIAFGYRKADPANQNKKKYRRYCYLVVILKCYKLNWVVIFIGNSILYIVYSLEKGTNSNLGNI
jgi:hypothetical protein